MFAKVFLLSLKNNLLPGGAAAAAARNFKRRKSFSIGTGSDLEF